MKKLFFFFLIILLFFSKTQNIFAYQSIFTVDNIVIEGKTDGNNHREKYIEIGFRKGFQKLIKNILRSEDQKKILSTDIFTIKSLVQNFSVKDEKIDEKNYRAEITVTFNEDLVNDFFEKREISYSASQRLETIIYPIFILNSELQVFSSNKFFEEWNDDKEFQDVNFILPVENIDDLNFIKKNIDDLEEIDLSRLVDNYEIKNSAILILRYDKKDLNVFLKTNFKNIKKLKKIMMPLKNIDNKIVRKETISKLKFFVHDTWKEQNLVDLTTPAYLTLNAEIKNPSTLGKLFKKINNINLIKNYYVQELDKDKAKIKIKYLGKIKNLESVLVENGFILKIEENEWKLVLGS